MTNLLFNEDYVPTELCNEIFNKFENHNSELLKEITNTILDAGCSHFDAVNLSAALSQRILIEFSFYAAQEQIKRNYSKTKSFKGEDSGQIYE